MGERRSGSRLKEMKVERDKDGQGWKEEDEAQMEAEMSMVIQLYHNCVLRNNEHIYNMPVIFHQQLQYIYYFSFVPV